MKVKSQNKSLKPTVTRVTPFAKKANPAPRYGGLVPPLNCLKKRIEWKRSLKPEILFNIPISRVIV